MQNNITMPYGRLCLERVKLESFFVRGILEEGIKRPCENKDHLQFTILYACYYKKKGKMFLGYVTVIFHKNHKKFYGYFYTYYCSLNR